MKDEFKPWYWLLVCCLFISTVAPATVNWVLGFIALILSVLETYRLHFKK